MPANSIFKLKLNNKKLMPKHLFSLTLIKMSANEPKENLEFIREIEVESRKVELKFTQLTVGKEACVVWDAGIVLGKYLDHQQGIGNTVINKSVIDLGSGTGVVGLYAAALGAYVTLTDLPEVVPLLEKNIQSNSSNLKGSATASVLIWGEDCSKFPSPDLILLSDCIYHEPLNDSLISTLLQLADSKTEILISFEDRVQLKKKETLRNFLETLRQSFDIDHIHSNELHPEYQCPDIHLLKCKKKKIDDSIH